MTIKPFRKCPQPRAPTPRAPDPAGQRAAAELLGELRRCRRILDLHDISVAAAYVDMAIQTLKREFGLPASLEQNVQVPPEAPVAH